jgi:homoserine dehydrogenase
MGAMEQQATIGSDGHQRLRLAIAGFGTVGSAVARILIEQSSGASSFELAYILNRRVAEKRVDWVPDSVRWTDDVDEVLDSNIDVFVNWWAVSIRQGRGCGARWRVASPW